MELAGSPALAQVVQNCRRRPQTTRVSGFPGRRKLFVQGATLVVGEVITFVVSYRVDDRSLGQRRRLIEDEPVLFNTGSETAHVPTVRVSEVPGKRYAARRSPSIWRSHGTIWFQLAGIGDPSLRRTVYQRYQLIHTLA